MKTRLLKIFSVVLSTILIICTASIAFAESTDNSEIPINAQVEFLDNGYKIVRTTDTVSNARSTTVTRYTKTACLDSNNVEQCSFTIYGDFNTATRQCVRSYFSTSTRGGAWRIEEPQQWNNGYTVYGSCLFVMRVLGIKIESRAENLKLSYI